jgi:putative FmdB family regulatory protein
MPTYEYKCSACDYAFEQFQSITADPIKKCPQCGKSKVKRLLGTGAGLIFKGSGFYITDYRSEAYQKAAKSEAPAGGESKAESTSSGESKADKAEAKPAVSSTSTETKPSAAAKGESASKSAAKRKSK